MEIFFVESANDFSLNNFFNGEKSNIEGKEKNKKTVYELLNRYVSQAELISTSVRRLWNMEQQPEDTITWEKLKVMIDINYIENFFNLLEKEKLNMEEFNNQNTEVDEEVIEMLDCSVYVFDEDDNTKVGVFDIKGKNILACEVSKQFEVEYKTLH